MSTRVHRAEAPLIGNGRLDTDADKARPPAFTDEALALRFADKHASNLRYVDVWGRWLTWDGIRWQFDDTLAAYDLVRATCRATSTECNNQNVAAALASAKTVAAVERLARSDRPLAATVDQWDLDPWLLNTPGGIDDLRSGRKSAHRADAYITQPDLKSRKGIRYSRQHLHRRIKRTFPAPFQFPDNPP